MPTEWRPDRTHELMDHYGLTVSHDPKYGWSLNWHHGTMHIGMTTEPERVAVLFAFLWQECRVPCAEALEAAMAMHSICKVIRTNSFDDGQDW